MQYPSALWQISPVAVALRSLVSHSSFCEGGKTDSLKVIFVVLCCWRSRSGEHLQSPYTPHSISLPIFVGGAFFFFFFYRGNKAANGGLFLPFWSRRLFPGALQQERQKNIRLALFIFSAMCGIMFPRVRVRFWSEINCGMLWSVCNFSWTL